MIASSIVETTRFTAELEACIEVQKHPQETVNISGTLFFNNFLSFRVPETSFWAESVYSARKDVASNVLASARPALAQFSPHICEEFGLR